MSAKNGKTVDYRVGGIREITIYVIQKMILRNKFGFTVDDLASELMDLPMHVPISVQSIQPEAMLVDIVNELALKGELDRGKLVINGVELDWFRPSRKFKLVPNAKIESIISGRSLFV